MRKPTSSLTAMGIAIMRAIESERPENLRVCFDPYARRLVSNAMYHLVRFFERLGYNEMRGPGVMGFLAARERHIDERLKACLAEGVQQVVILGAGLDARAYCFEEFKHDVKVFEVDQPGTQQAKLEAVQRVFGRVPDYVTYVPVDLISQTLEDCLPASGYDRTLKTLFIWQGVTQYLNPQAVDQILAFVHDNCASGSSIIFDYMYTSLLDGTVRHGEVRKMNRDPVLKREALTFGIPEGTIEIFLKQRGFTDVQDADGKMLHELYFTGERAARTVADGYAVVWARIS